MRRGLLGFPGLEPKSCLHKAVQKEIPDHIPCVHVAVVDGHGPPNELELRQIEGSTLCEEYELDEPLILPQSRSRQPGEEIFASILVKATRPSLARPISRERRLALDKASQNKKYLLIAGAAIAVCTLAAILFRSSAKSNKSQWKRDSGGIK